MIAPDELVFETERTWVRQWRESDADRVLDINSRWDVVRWLDDDPTVMTHRDEAVDRIASWRGIRERLGEPCGQWAVQDRETGVTVGCVLLVPLPTLNRDGTREIQVGWHLHPDSTGRGYAREAATGALAYGFAHGLTEIRALMYTDNDPSVKVALAIGMDDLGVATDQWYAGDSRVFWTTADSLVRAGVR